MWSSLVLIVVVVVFHREKEKALKEQASNMATEVTHLKLQAHREKMELVNQVQDLQGEVSVLLDTLAEHGISPPTFEE